MIRLPPDPPSRALTQREQVVLRLVAAGLSNAEIADRLSLSLNTVKWHVRHVLAKLDVTRRAQAVAIAHSLGVADEPAGSLVPPLPIPPTPFVGRQRELAQVVDLLTAPETRLVSIVGTGGIGKTRLALAAAARWQQRTPIPVHFVALENVPRADGVVPAVAEAIGFQFGGTLDLRQQLIFGLRQRELLLVVDNCEHLLEAAPLFADILAVAPGLRLLATSRERLNLRGETVLALAGLDYPSDDQPAQDGAAVQFFLTAARRLRPDFTPTDEDLRHISLLCRWVEGMPLALELAAGWVDTLSLAQLVDEVRASLSLLTSAARDAPDRHRSMEAVFAQSWSRLTTSEQTAFKKLAVFRGGFDRDAAEQVAGASLDVLKQLVSKSLVTPTPDGRFKLHELLRQFAEEKRQADPDDDRRTLYAHCHYYAARLEQYDTLIKADMSTLGRCMTETYRDFDNVLAGWYQALERPFPSEIGRHFLILSLMFQGRGLFGVAEQTFALARQVFETSPDQATPVDWLPALIYSAWMAGALSKLDDALALLDRAFRLLESLDEPFPPDVGFLWSFRGWVALLRGEPALARQHLRRSVALCRETHFEIGEWSGLGMSGVVEFSCGNYSGAIQFHQEGLNLAERNQFIQGIIYDITGLANAWCMAGDYSLARDLLRRSLTLNRELFVPDPTLLAITGIALFVNHQGDPATALEMLAAVLHHPQCSSISRIEAEHALALCRAHFSAREIDAVMDRARQGQVATAYLNSNFSLDRALIDRLLLALADEQVP
jgi:predicted ATPase/DNA-binding CsgD family transcriptional regulator